jgi:hypothetical protein
MLKGSYLIGFTLKLLLNCINLYQMFFDLSLFSLDSNRSNIYSDKVFGGGKGWVEVPEGFRENERNSLIS